MRQTAKKFDRNSVGWRNDHNRGAAESFLARALAFTQDADRKARNAARECKVCWYLYRDRIGGAAITSKPCDCCGNEETYGSTNTDAVCPECATEHKLCKHCGGDVDLRDRRDRGVDGRLAARAAPSKGGDE